MRWLLVALALAAGAVVCLSVPMCVDSVLMRQERAAHEKLIRDRAAETVEKYKEKYAGKSEEEWTETDKEVYKNALRMRDEGRTTRNSNLK
jgi:hypothetical protein